MAKKWKVLTYADDRWNLRCALLQGVNEEGVLRANVVGFRQPDVCLPVDAVLRENKRRASSFSASASALGVKPLQGRKLREER